MNVCRTVGLCCSVGARVRHVFLGSDNIPLVVTCHSDCVINDSRPHQCVDNVFVFGVVVPETLCGRHVPFTARS